MKKFLSVLSAAAVLASSAAPVFAESLALETNNETTAATQALIDARPDIQRPMEALDRGLVAVKTADYAFVSWRWLGTESASVQYNLYRNGEKINPRPLNVTNYTDLNPTDGATYQVAPVENGVEGEKCEAVSLMDNAYIDVPIEKPEDNTVNGESYTYSAGDATVADVDGDMQYEIILKWDPSNAKDAASAGYTGECIIDCYETDGTRRWRINMGPNIRSGAHDTQILAYDFDSDGKAEVALRTADGTIAGDGSVIGDESKNYALANEGKNLTGPLYVTMFNGEDGSVIDTVEYYPQITGKLEDGTEWDITSWGDGWGNRSERYLGCVAYLDGASPSAVFARGYYTGPEGTTGGRTAIAAYDLVDGKIQTKWIFDTMNYENQYIGQGNHSMAAADVDYDGCDELIYGALAIDNDGQPMYSTGLGHGDAQHVGDLDPSRPGLEVYSCHESTGAEYGYEMRDARTGEIIYGENTGTDNGRGASDDIDPNYPGCEGWSAAGVLTAADGTVITREYTMPANFFAWWDGDLGREVQDGIYISKWNPQTMRTDTIFSASGCVAVNGTKANPSLTADLFGDWREEVMYPLKDSSALRIFTTTEPTDYRLPTLMHDIQYRLHVAEQNVCYNQPTHTSYYLGYDTETVPVPQMYTVVNGEEVRNPDLASKNWNISDLYDGETVTLVLDCPTALKDGSPSRIDNDDETVVPFLAEGDRTLVPMRFIAEAFGAEVSWAGDTSEVTIVEGDTTVVMAVGAPEYTINGQTHTMDVAPLIQSDRTFVPLRAAAEALGRQVFWSDGLIIISDLEQDYTAEEAAMIKESIQTAAVPERIVPTAVAEGEKFFQNQADIFGVTASDNDGNVELGAVDLDMSTRWSAFGANTLVLDLGEEKTITGVAIAMWKGAERIYPFTIEVSSDGKTWTEALPKSQNTGTSEEFETYEFPAAVSGRYVRYSGDGATDPEKNYCHISEIAVLLAE